MATENIRILHIGTADFTDLQNTQIGYMTGNDGDLSYPMWGGVDNSGNVTRWLAKDKDARVNDMYLKDTSHGGTDAALLVHSGDNDTYIEFQSDQIDMYAGGFSAVKIVESAEDYVQMGFDLRMNGKELQAGTGNDLTIELGDDAAGNNLIIQDSGNTTIFTMDSDGVSQFTNSVGINISPTHELDVQSQSGNASIRVKAPDNINDDAYISAVAGTSGNAKLALGDEDNEALVEFYLDNGADTAHLLFNDVGALSVDSSANITMIGDLTIEAQFKFGDRTDVGAGGTSGSPTTQSVAESSYYTVQVSGAGDEYYRFINPTDGQVILVDPKDAGDGPPGSAYFDRDPTGGSPDYVLLDYGPYLIVYTASDSRWTIL